MASKAIAYPTQWILECADPGTEKLDLGGREFGLATVDSMQVAGCIQGVEYKEALAVDTVEDCCMVSRE